MRGAVTAYSPTATGSRVAAEKLVAPRCLAKHKVQVLGKEVTFIYEALSGLPHLFPTSALAWAVMSLPAGAAS